MVKFDTGDMYITTNKAILTVSCYRSCNDVVKFDTGDNVTLLQTKPSLLCHVTGVVMMW